MHLTFIGVYPVLVFVPKSPPLGELAFDLHVIKPTSCESRPPSSWLQFNDVWSGIRSRIVHSNYSRYHKKIAPTKFSCAVDTGKQAVITFHLLDAREVYNSLLDGCSRKQKPQKAMEYLNDMISASKWNDPTTAKDLSKKEDADGGTKIKRFLYLRRSRDLKCVSCIQSFDKNHDYSRSITKMIHWRRSKATYRGNLRLHPSTDSWI